MATLIEARYRLTTPLFNGGADPSAQDARPELRLASFKGVLRFWWRALAWSRCNGDLTEIQRQENQLFGSTSTGQAQVRMRLGSRSPDTCLSKDSLLTEARGSRDAVGMGARYLGYGLMGAFGAKAGRVSRAAVLAPLVFSVQLRASGLDDGLADSLVQALIALGSLGGMGSRSRKGYGSLVLQSIDLDGRDHWQAPRTEQKLLEALADLGRGSRQGLPPYTALSREARHLILSADQCREPLHLLDLIGREMVRYRSWGNQGMVLQSIPSERNFRHDHDLMKKPLASRRSHPERIAFGLPHNYGKGSINEVSPDGTLDRRASPLFIHLHQCGDRPVAVLSFLPARFLPATSGGRPATISVGGAKVPQKPEAELYRPIHAFLDRLLDEHTCRESFSSVQEVGR